MWRSVPACGNQPQHGRGVSNDRFARMQGFIHLRATDRRHSTNVVLADPA
jgi:hypothetical protein